MNLLKRVDFLPAFLERLKEEPEKVVKEFEAFRDGCEFALSCSSIRGELTRRSPDSLQ
jgi:hypothetical protein